MTGTAGSLITAFDYIWDRFTGRLAGLTDEEYFWEPVPGGWSLRQRPDGSWRLDGGDDAPGPAPVTTIAWRICHLAGQNLGGFAEMRFGSPGPAGARFPGRVADLPGFLSEQYSRWRDGMAGLGADDWEAPLGPSWGPYAESNTVDLALHVLDELVHHAAEVGLLRDLYSHRSQDCG
jgi:DinB family protein